MKKVIILTITMLCACTSTQRHSMGNAIRIDSMIGNHYTEVMNIWGPPSHRTPDGMGGQLMIWYESRILNAPNDTQFLYGDIAERDKSFFRSQASNDEENVYTFWINANGYIYRTSYGQEPLLP